jgi:hypothetical protein
LWPGSGRVLPSPFTASPFTTLLGNGGTLPLPGHKAEPHQKFANCDCFLYLFAFLCLYTSFSGIELRKLIIWILLFAYIKKYFSLTLFIIYNITKNTI